MAAARPDDPRAMSEADYLAFEAASAVRHEYSQGYAHAMTGGSVRHSVITANISARLHQMLADRDCTVTSPDLRIYIAAKGSYRYPDVTVFCGAPAYRPGRDDTITNPALLVEVTSPSTALLDRNDKLAEYTQIDSLQAYLLVAQDTPRVERFLRHDSGQWLYANLTGAGAQVVLPPLGLTLALSDIYHKVPWDDTSPGM